MAHSCNKRPASVALDQDTPQPGDDDDALGFALSPQDLRRRLLNPPERLSSSLRGSIFPWGMPRELWEMVAAYLDKQDMDALALVSRDVREQVWLTTPGRRYAVPLGMVREAVARAMHPSSAALVPARHSIEANACVADITALGDFLRLYSHVHRLTIRSPVNYPFTLPLLPNLHSLALVLSDIPLPFDKPLPVRGMCLELTRWRQPVSDIARLSMHTQLRTLKLFVNRIGGVSPAVLDLSPLRALSDLHELHVVSYQLNRPLLTLPFLGALTQLELHSVIVTPSELYAYSSLTSLRLSLLSMPGDADEVIATVFRKNTGLRSLAISWGGDVEDELPCHCMRSAPPTVERLALAPLVDFRSISHLTKLSYLDLRSCHSAFSVARFPDLTSLRTLVIDDRPPFRDRHLNVLASVQRVLIVAEGDDNGLAARVRTAAPQIQVLVNPPERLLEL